MELKTRERVQEAVFHLYSTPHAERITVRNVVKAAGLPSNTINHWYGGLENLYRVSVLMQISRLSQCLKQLPPKGISPRHAVLAYSGLCADIFASDTYNRLLYLVVRDGALNSWLPQRHRSEILQVVERNLSIVVLTSGAARGERLEMRWSAARAFVKRLQSELALPMLIPGHKGFRNRELRQFVESIATEAMAAVYSERDFVRVLEGLPDSRAQASQFSQAPSDLPAPRHLASRLRENSVDAVATGHPG